MHSVRGAVQPKGHPLQIFQPCRSYGKGMRAHARARPILALALALPPACPPMILQNPPIFRSPAPKKTRCQPKKKRCQPKKKRCQPKLGPKQRSFLDKNNARSPTKTTLVPLIKQRSFLLSNNERSLKQTTSVVLVKERAYFAHVLRRVCSFPSGGFPISSASSLNFASTYPKRRS